MAEANEASTDEIGLTGWSKLRLRARRRRGRGRGQDQARARARARARVSLRLCTEEKEGVSGSHGIALATRDATDVGRNNHRKWRPVVQE